MKEDDNNNNYLLGYKKFIIIVFLFLIIIAFRTFICSRAIVYGESMFPELKEGDVLIIQRMNNEISYRDIVVINMGFMKEKLIKRVVALPGDYVVIRNNCIFINDTLFAEDVKYRNGGYGEWTLGEDEFFVLGDNYDNSKDSRSIGPIKHEQIEGIAKLRIYPFTKIKGYYK